MANAGKQTNFKAEDYTLTKADYKKKQTDPDFIHSVCSSSNENTTTTKINAVFFLHKTHRLSVADHLLLAATGGAIQYYGDHRPQPDANYLTRQLSF